MVPDRVGSRGKASPTVGTPAARSTCIHMLVPDRPVPLTTSMRPPRQRSARTPTRRRGLCMLRAGGIHVWFALGLATAWAATVPGTGWQLDASATWRPSEVDHLAALARDLPPALTALTPTLIRDSSQPDDGLHPGVEPTRRGRELVLHGPGEAVDARELVHALAHRLDAEHHLSTDPDWTRISGWGRYGRRRTPLEHARSGFASDAGLTSALDDLASTVALAFTPPAPGDPAVHPRCRMPAKWRFVEEYIGPPLPGGDCAGLTHAGLDPAAVTHLDLVFIRASTGHVASIAGHTALRVDLAPSGQPPRSDAYTLSAVTGGEGGAGYVLRGLTGGWLSAVSRQPYSTLAHTYAIEEGRDLERHRLLLDGDQRLAVLERLRELREGWQRPYLFFRRNCTQLPRALGEAAPGRPLRLPTSAPPDALLAALYRRDLLTPQPVDALQDVALQVRAAAASGLRRREARAAAVRLRTVSGAPSRRAFGYAAWGDTAAAAPAEALVARDRVLDWSGTVERARLLTLPPSQADAQTAVFDALRGARGAVRDAAAAHAIELATVSNPRAALLDAVQRPPPTGSAHTGLRAVWLGGAWDGASTPWVVLGSQVYRSRLGEGRRFALAPGLQVSFLVGSLGLRPGPEPAVRTEGQLFELVRVAGDTPFLLPAIHLRVGDLSLAREPSATPLAATWVELGPGVELWQAGLHRHHLLITAGLAAHTTTDLSQPSGTGGTGLGLPIRTELALASPGLTELVLSGLWRPVFATGGRRTDRGADARLRLGLGEIAGAGCSLVARGRLSATTLGDSLGTEVGVDWVVERF
ncbi:MAG: hypothetical protein ACI8PZ_007236 [Myxococcota bacterium]|jgi:hypothetical protein